LNYHGEHGELRDCSEQVIDMVLTAATRVHSTFGPGLLESVYEMALFLELESMAVRVERQVDIPVQYRGRDLGVGFRADLVIERSLLLEIKSIEALKPVHLAQLITYLRLMRIKRGFLLNFNNKLLKQGIKRVSI
jgi:GxxExxY protein